MAESIRDNTNQQGKIRDAGSSQVHSQITASPLAPAGAQQARPGSNAAHLSPTANLNDDLEALPSSTSRAEFTTVYDILERMEAMFDEAKSPIFSSTVVKINKDEFVNAVTELKKMLPVQLERASALMREAERRLDTAQTQANAIVSEAKSRAADLVKEAGEQAEFLAGQENIVAIAQQKGQAIIEKAQARSDKLVHGANQYSSQIMEALAAQLERYQQDVSAGVEVLREREQEAANRLEQSYSEGLHD